MRVNYSSTSATFSKVQFSTSQTLKKERCFQLQIKIVLSTSVILQVWDLVTNTLIDVMKCKMHCTALCFSSSGEYFATCHHEQRSVYLWANKTHFAPVTILNSLPFDFEPSTSSLPSYGCVVFFYCIQHSSQITFSISKKAKSRNHMIHKAF